MNFEIGLTIGIVTGIVVGILVMFLTKRNKKMNADKTESFVNDRVIEGLKQEIQQLKSRLSQAESSNKANVRELEVTKDALRLSKDKIVSLTEQLRVSQDDLVATQRACDELKESSVASKNRQVLVLDRKIVELLSDVYVDAEVENCESVKKRINLLMSDLGYAFVDYSESTKLYYQVVKCDDPQVRIERRAVVRKDTDIPVLPGKVYVPR
jgi:chromosome segregation ATPase